MFSLSYHKIIQCGEGGIAVTNNGKLAEKMALIRNHAEAVVSSKGIEDQVNLLGWNYRMTELQAAVAIPQFNKLKDLVKIRVELAEKLSDILSYFDFLSAPVIEKDCEHCFYLYPIRYDAKKADISRNLFCKALKAENFPILEIIGICGNLIC